MYWALFDIKVGADLYSMSARASYESGKSKETLAGREEWYRSEEQRQAAGIAKGSPDWTPTGGFIAPGVIDNGKLQSTSVMAEKRSKRTHSFIRCT